MNLMKRMLCMLLAIVMVAGMLPVRGFAAETEELQVIDEITELADIEIHLASTYALDASGKVQLKSGNYEKWIDRLDLSGAVDESSQNYAQRFYQWLETNATAAGGLGDPEGAAGKSSTGVVTLTSNGVTYYAYSVAKVTGTLTGVAATDSEAREANRNAAMAHITAVFNAFDRDHPEVFWLSGRSSMLTRTATGSSSYTQEFYFLLRGSDGNFDVRADKYQTAGALEQAIAVRDESARKLVEQVKGLTTRYEKVKTLNSLLTTRNCYNSNVSTAGHDAHECISALEGRIGSVGPVCEGYARALKVLCDQLSIPCVLVNGVATNSSGNSEAHMWNYVQMDDGKWYAVDVTWNDPTISGANVAVSGSERESYLLVGGNTVVDGRTFLQSHPEYNASTNANFNTVSTSGPSFINGPELEAKAYNPAAVCTHSYSAWKVTEEAGCETEGTQERSCTLCGKTETKAVAAKGHTEETDPAEEATCTATGKTEGKFCSVCGLVLQEQTEVPMKEHTYANGACTVCGAADPNAGSSGNAEYVLKGTPFSTPVAGLGATASFNINNNTYYGYFANTVKSVLAEENGGYIRAEYIGNDIVVEWYDANYGLQKQKDVPLELPIFGGIYICDDYNFVVTGQTNHEEDNNKEVIRVTRYSKDWERQASCGLYGANTTIPFDAGSLRFARSGDYLYIRTCHEMYTNVNDGLNHQANVTMNVRISDMTVTDSYTIVMNVGKGYVSHSFNQFIQVDGSDLLAVDHGDYYPRAVVLMKYKNPAGQAAFTGSVAYENVLPIAQNTGHYNYTGVSVGGFEFSDTHYLVAGSSCDQSGGISQSSAQRNIFVTVTPKGKIGDNATTVKWFTDYEAADNVRISTPHLVKTGSNSFCLMWTVGDTLSFCMLDGQGNRTSEIFTGTGYLSDCAPIVANDKIVWYVTNSDGPIFFEINLTPNAHTHSYGAWSVTQEADCENQGVMERVCSCGKTESEAIPAKGHTEVIDEAVEATCTATGKTEGKHCSVCAKVLVEQTEIPKEAHNYENGVCTECGEGTCTHSFSAWTVTREAACETEGTQERECSLCGKTETEAIPAKGHTEVIDEAVEATCTATGKTEGKHCSVCAKVLVEQTEIPKKDHTYENGVCTECGEGTCTHSFSDWTVTKEAACETEGTQERECSLCGETETEAIAATGHTEVIDEAVEATCTATGKTEGKHCSVCAKVLVEQTEIPKEAHNYENGVCTECGEGTCTHSFSDWTVTKEAACETEGTQERECSLCGETETEAIPAAGHTEELVPAVAPGCTTTGKTEGKRCAVCGKVTAAQTTVPALGHNYQNDICTNCGHNKNTPAGTVVRIAGAGRCETAREVADALKEELGVDKFEAILYTSGLNFADALAGSYLSAVKNAPILLYWQNGTNVQDNLDYIRNNLADGGTVYILGGFNAVPESVNEALTDLGIKFQRVSGENRYLTNIEILKASGFSGGKVLVCTSHNFADSLSASATGLPILLVYEQWRELSKEYKDYLASFHNLEFIIVGGASAVHSDLMKSLENTYGKTKVSRLAGTTRFETSVMVAEECFGAPQEAVLAYAMNFPDGLCGGALAYAKKAPLILTKTNATSAAEGYVQSRNITSGAVLGSDELIDDPSVEKIFGTGVQQPEQPAPVGGDTDGDGLADGLEDLNGTNPTKPDTDGDGLNDLLELEIGTDGTLVDTDGNGVEDGDEDTDNDGLTNLEELALGTDLTRMDTDMDGLTDGEEVGTYRTDPLKADTDGDGVSDGYEVDLGTDPLTAQATFQISKTSQSSVEDSFTASVNIELSGQQVESLEITPIDDPVLFPTDMPGYMGEAFDFFVEGSFDTAEIQFTFDISTLTEGSQPAIFYFDEINQTLEELPTTVVDNIATATVEHFSTYVLIDRTIYYKAFAWEDVWSTEGTYDSVEVVFVIDDSGSLGGDYGYDQATGYFTGGNDPEHLRLSAARDFVDNSTKSAKIGIVKFDGVVDVFTELLTCDESGKNTLKNLLQITPDIKGNTNYNSSDVFDSRGYTYMYTGIDAAFDLFTSAEETLKVIIVFTDGMAHDEEMHSSVVAEANNRGVRVYTVGLGSSTSYFTDYLQPLAEDTGGVFYMTSDANQLMEIYQDIGKKIDIETDTDGDKIPDYYEDNMIAFNGKKIDLDKNNPDTDGDGLADGEEVEVELIYNSDKTKVYVKGKLWSDPTLVDTDYDGVKDNLESSREERMDTNFTGSLLGYYDIKDANYTFDYRNFFKSKTSYNSEITSASLMLANAIYNNCGFSYDFGKKTTSIKEMMEYHGFENVTPYVIAKGCTVDGLKMPAYTDDDISEICIGHYEVTYKETTKTIVGIAVRGTNGTIEEWSSNFDVGDTDQWKSQNHKGFAVAESRINEFVKLYMAKYLPQTGNVTYWLTGHSRGAAIANLLAARLIDEGNEVYAYTFATPYTTVNTAREDARYSSIFNITNTSDFVTYVPLREWDFGRFGVSYFLSVEDSNLQSQWCSQTGVSKYNAMNKNVITMATSRIAKSCCGSWDEVHDRAGSQDIDDAQYGYISDRAKRYCKLEERTSWGGDHKGYKLYPSTAFLFQLGAEMVAGSKTEKDNVKSLIPELWNSKYTAVIALFLGDAYKNKDAFKGMELGTSLIGDAHAPATYYILTQ